MSDEQSWKAMKETKKRDLDEFRRAFGSYCRFNFAMNAENPEVPPLNAKDLEIAFRKDNFKVYLIAKKKKIGPQYVCVSPGGQIGMQYQLIFSNTPDAPRKKDEEGWPKSVQENLERLESAGFLLDSGVPVCGNCGERGHVFKSCPKEKVESGHEAPKIKYVHAPNTVM